MKTKPTTTKKKNLSTPGEPLTENEFSQIIKDAENGSFISLDVFKKEVQEWIKKEEK